jgi:hypothetical protein
MNWGYRYSTLEHFFGAYFHQDFLMDDPDWESVCDRYVRDEGKQAAMDVANEIQKLLECGLDQKELYASLQDFGCHYFPGDLGGYPQWLNDVSKRLLLLSS